MCVESVSPVVAGFAEPATRHAFQQALNAAWKSVSDRASDPFVVRARSLLNDFPESDCDDSHNPAYKVNRALSILAYALDGIIEDDSAQRAISACAAAVEIYGGCDVVLTQGNQALKINPANPPPAGRLESLQIQSQLHSINEVRNVVKSPNEIVKLMRASATQLAFELDRVLPVYAQLLGWKMRTQLS